MRSEPKALFYKTVLWKLTLKLFPAALPNVWTKVWKISCHAHWLQFPIPQTILEADATHITLKIFFYIQPNTQF